MLTDGRTTDGGVTGILIAHLGAFGSGELKSSENDQSTGHFQRLFFFRPPYPKSEKKNPVNQLIKKFWPKSTYFDVCLTCREWQTDQADTIH